MKPAHSQSLSQLQHKKANIREDEKSIKLRESETFGEICKLLGVRGSGNSLIKTNEDTPGTRKEREIPLIKKRSTKFKPLSINLPGLKNLLVNIDSNLNTATEVELGLPYILQTVRPWSSGVRFYSSNAIYIRKPKVLETILKKNRKVVPRVGESKEVNKESPITNKEICKKYSLICERR